MMIYQKQTGASLVEIMVSLTLSMFLIGGVLHIFISNKQAYRLNSAYSEIQENGRFISHYLPNIIRQSGYRSPPDDAMFPALDDIFPAGSPHLQVANNTGTNGSDVITIRYQGSGSGLGTPDGTVTDCLNQGVDAGVIATNVFSINANNELQCQATNPSVGAASTQVLISGVESMHVLYGEDLDNDRIADRYVAPNFAGININNIVSMRMSILISSSDEVVKAIDDNTYYLSGTVYNPADDFRIRKTISLTVHLRNVASL